MHPDAQLAALLTHALRLPVDVIVNLTRSSANTQRRNQSSRWFLDCRDKACQKSRQSISAAFMAITILPN